MEWTLCCLTYNVNGRKAVNGQVTRLLQDENFDDADVAAVGFQEISHAELLGAVSTEDTWAHMVTVWMAQRSRLLLYKATLASNILLVFARLHIFVEINKLDLRQTRATLGGLTGHKGCLALRIIFKNQKALVLITSHLLPNSDGYAKRCEQYQSSKQHCAYENEENQNAVQAPTIVWMGDLNWRVDSLTPEDMADELDRVELTDMDKFVERVDQLRRAQKSREAFAEYSEAPITFHPTYRLTVGTKEFDLLRVPSWCDRILFRGDHLVCDRYRSNRSITLSDHFPVAARFKYAYSSSKDGSEWNVEFEGMHRWLSVIPFTISFTFKNTFWVDHGSFRDWVAVYSLPMSDPSQPLQWIYVAACYESNVSGKKPATVAEFAPLPPGEYRVGYFSIYTDCLQGLSDIFEVEASS